MSEGINFSTYFDAVFFDLDGTLLGIPDEKFEEIYTKLIVQRFKDQIEPETFMNALWKGTEAMYQHNNEDKFVLESFFDTFTKLTGIERNETYTRFDRFYRNEFGKLAEMSVPVPEARQLVDILHDMDKTVVLATNPVFPEIATRRRCEWTGVGFDEYSYVSHAENSHFCKPNPNYFQRLVDLTGVNPERTLMVGNDYLFDMAAAKIGIKTWIIDKFHGNTEYKEKAKVDYSGSLSELLAKFQ